MSTLIIVVVVLVLLMLARYVLAAAVRMGGEHGDASKAETAWMRGWRSIDWAASGLEALSYGERDTTVHRPRIDRVWMSPTGPRARIALPLGVSGSHVDLSAIHRLEGLLPGTAPMSVVDRDRRSVTLSLDTRDPLGGDQKSSAHSATVPDPAVDRIAYLEALSKRHRQDGAQ